MIKLREMRNKRGMTQAELAWAVGPADPTVDQATISVLERGDLYPGEKLRDAICEALQCEEADLYDGVEAMFVPSAEKEYSDSTMILAEIFKGCSKYVPRHELRQQIQYWTGEKINDRTMREWISKARSEGLVIANDQDGYGYYLPTTAEECERQLAQMMNRTMTQLAQMKYLRKKIREMRA